MAEKTKPLSIRLSERDIEQLHERAKRVCGTPTGVARDFIRTGLVEGDSRGQAEQLLKIERKAVAIDQQLQRLMQSNEQEIASLENLLTMFEALLSALTASPSNGGIEHA